MKVHNNLWFIHSGAGVGQGGIERVNQEIIDGWKTVSQLDFLSFQPKKNIKSIIEYIKECRTKDFRTTIFMHLGLSKFLIFGQPRGPIKIFLHGIECWKRIPLWHRCLLNKVDHFISNSKFTWDRFLQFNPEFSHVRHDVVHLGLGEPVEYSEPDSDIPAVLIIGRMSRSEDYKGHRELISLWSMVRAQVPNAELWIVGSGDLKPELEKLAQGHEGIIFYGKVSEENKLDLLRRCRCFAMPSRNEGFGLVYLEAMRMGRPCLVSDCDAALEIINSPELGRSVSVIDKIQIVNGIIEILDLGSFFADRCRQVYSDNFTSAQFLARFKDEVFDV